MNDGNGGLVLLGAGVFLGWLLFGRRRSGPPAPRWGVLRQGSGPSAKGTMLVILAVAGLLLGVGMAGAGVGVAPAKKGSGPTLAGIFGALPMPGNFELVKPAKGAPKAVRFAMDQVGDRYVYGANGPHSWDCSGLTEAAWRNAGVKIPGTAQTQLDGLPRVKGKPRAGDLVVYRSQASPSGYHVAIAVGQGQMVEARGRRYGVTHGRIRGGWLGVVRPGGR